MLLLLTFVPKCSPYLRPYVPRKSCFTTSTQKLRVQPQGYDPAAILGCSAHLVSLLRSPDSPCSKPRLLACILSPPSIQRTNPKPALQQPQAYPLPLPNLPHANPKPVFYYPTLNVTYNNPEPQLELKDPNGSHLSSVGLLGEPSLASFGV